MNYFGVISLMGKKNSTLLTNLYAVYKGENNANDSLGTYNGTAQGGLTYNTGKSGDAFLFNGTNAYVKLPDNMFNSFTGDFSISMWVNVFNTGTLQALLSCKAYNGTNYYGFSVYNYGGTYFQILNGTSTAVNLQETYPNPYYTWYHVVVTRKGSTRSRIYYNGSLTTANTDPTNPVYYSGTNNCTIGVSNFAGALGLAYYVGNGTKIDELNIWDKELTASEVTDLYNSGTGKFYPTF